MTTPSELDDPESVDATPLDLTPRPTRPAHRGTRRVVGLVVLAAVVVGVGVVVFQGLNNATLFFYNVDEAVQRRDEIGDRRIRIQGNVIEGSVVNAEGDRPMRFVLRFGDGEVTVEHRGEVPALFKPAIPVVLEGSFVGDVFRSDRMLLRHDDTYDEEHPDRQADAERDARRTP